jgi:NAD(P)-dependent dehydrogenase (short-subunit alcohol dehydrogenase family)
MVEMDAEFFNEHLRVNTCGTFLMTREVAREVDDPWP